MLDNQLTLEVSPYSNIYDIIVPKTHFLRQLTELCNFSFVYDELEKNYRPDFGRRAYSPIMMFKHLLLNDIYQLSDIDVVERSFSDMAFKYFFGLAPEDPVIESSSLTKFRKLRIKDQGLLDLLIAKSVQIALELGLIKSHIPHCGCDPYQSSLQIQEAARNPPRTLEILEQNDLSVFGGYRI